MQKWEYLRLDVFFRKSRKAEEMGVESVQVNYVQTLVNLPFPEFHNYINTLGGEGWEMVGYDAQEVHGFYYFKRPIE